MVAQACGGAAKQKPADVTPKSNEPVAEAVPDEGPAAVSKEACALEPVWPMFQGESGRSGASEAPAIGKPKVLWSARVGVQTWNNNPIVAGNLVIVGSSGDVWNSADPSDGVYAFDAKSGELAWFTPAENDVNGVALANCRIVAGSDDGKLRGLDPITGKVAWTKDFGSKVYGQPLPITGGVVVTTQNSGVHLVEPVQGRVTWSIPTGEVRQGAAFDGESIWIVTTEGRAIRVGTDGKLQWSGDSPASGEYYGSPTIVPDGAIFGYARDTTGSTPALTGVRMSGGPFWDSLNRGTKSSWANVRSSPAFVDGRLYHAEAYSNEIVTTDVASGRVEAVTQIGTCMFPHWGSPVANSEEVIVARHDGGLYAIGRDDQQFRWGILLGSHAESGRLLTADDNDGSSCSWSSEEGSLFATPAVGRDGTLYVGSRAGFLYAIGR